MSIYRITTKKGRGYRRDHTKFFKEISKEYKDLKFFIRYYNSIDGLAEGEWVTLIQQARHGNEWARTRLFDTSMQKTIKQAYAVSKKFDLDFENTLQASSFGILYAISAFDETEHSSFPSYVPLAVNSQLRRDVYLHSNPVIDFPTYLMNDFFKIHTLVKEHNCSECAYSNNKLTCENLRNEIQDKLKSTAEEVDECIKYLQPLEDLWEDSPFFKAFVTTATTAFTNSFAAALPFSVSTVVISLPWTILCHIEASVSAFVITACNLSSIFAIFINPQYIAGIPYERNSADD